MQPLHSQITGFICPAQSYKVKSFDFNAKVISVLEVLFYKLNSYVFSTLCENLNESIDAIYELSQYLRTEYYILREVIMIPSY